MNIIENVSRRGFLQGDRRQRRVCAERALCARAAVGRGRGSCRRWD